ncbi:MAG: hypothetical protein AB7T37_13100, partial [Dehalococcoidia bacterium]
TLSAQEIAELDASYDAVDENRRPTSWGWLVHELRGIRRKVESGVVVQVEEGPELRSWSDFYQWAHGRYHSLEDGYDKWIGDDR